MSWISKVVTPIGAVDGVNRIFTTPTNFVPGSVRVLVNGVWYTSADPKLGWVETPPNTFTMNSTPPASWVLQCAYDSEAAS